MQIEILKYLAEVSFSLLVLYLFYALLLHKETFFTANRLFLLSAIIFSLSIPFIQIEIEQQPIQLSSFIFPEFAATSNAQVELANSNSTSPLAIPPAMQIQWPLAIYLSGCIIFLAQFLISLIKLFLQIKQHEIVHCKGMKHVVGANAGPIYSFFNYVFLNKEQAANGQIELVLRHEETHARQRHSLDLLLVEVLKIFFWFNPVVHFYRKSLEEIHEYLADQSVVDSSTKLSDYRYLLYSVTEKSHKIKFIHCFDGSLIKRRLMMLTTNRSQKHKFVKYALVIPLLLCCVYFISFSAASAQQRLGKYTFDKKAYHPDGVGLPEESMGPMSNWAINSEFKFEPEAQEIYYSFYGRNLFGNEFRGKNLTITYTTPSNELISDSTLTHSFKSEYALGTFTQNKVEILALNKQNGEDTFSIEGEILRDARKSNGTITIKNGTFATIDLQIKSPEMIVHFQK